MTLEASVLAVRQANATPSEEDSARAYCYAALAQCFLQAPDQTALRALAALPIDPTATSLLATSGARLSRAAASASPRAVEAEFEGLFVAVGQPKVNPLAAHYLERQGRRHTLASLRGCLVRLGVKAGGGWSEPEDHVGFLLETMRLLISRDATRMEQSAAAQREVFESHIKPWYADFCAAVRAAPEAEFYRLVADFSESFLDVEAQAFEIEC